MGTNFYLRRRLTLKEKLEIHEDLEFGRYDEVREKLPEDIHIGKRSAGWKFLWDAQNFKHFKPNEKSLHEFLKSGEIIDEYGQKFTYQQFFEEEISGFLDKGHDAESYVKTHPDEPLNPHYYYTQDDISKYREKFGLDVNYYGEFYIGKYRFTYSVDFG